MISQVADPLPAGRAATSSPLPDLLCRQPDSVQYPWHAVRAKFLHLRGIVPSFAQSRVQICGRADMVNRRNKHGHKIDSSCQPLIAAKPCAVNPEHENILSQRRNGVRSDLTTEDQSIRIDPICLVNRDDTVGRRKRAAAAMSPDSVGHAESLGRVCSKPAVENRPGVIPSNRNLRH